MNEINLKDQFVNYCVQYGVIESVDEVDLNEDLVDSGIIDSMGMTTLKCMVEEVYKIVIPESVFIVELRTISDVVRYIELNRGHNVASLI